MNRSQRVQRWVELVVMFAVAPAVLAVFMRGYLVFPAIWTLAAECLVVLWRDPTFDRRTLRRVGSVREAAAGVVFPFVVLASLLAGALWLYEPERLLSLPLGHPGLWAIIMVGYPVLSVGPQEVAFRVFFVHRYEPLMGRRELIVLGAAAFGFAHVIMHNWIAVAFCTIGGVLFMCTYLRTRSLVVVSAEHALYGCYLFTLGWGQYLYGGSIGR